MDIDVLWVWLQEEVETALDAALPATCALDDEARYALSADITHRIHSSMESRICIGTQAQRDLCVLEALWSASPDDTVEPAPASCPEPCPAPLKRSTPPGA